MVLPDDLMFDLCLMNKMHLCGNILTYLMNVFELAGSGRCVGQNFASHISLKF